MDRETAIKEIESYITDISFTTTTKNAIFPSTETLGLCLSLLKEDNLIRKEDLMSLIINTNFCNKPHWRKEEMLDDILLNHSNPERDELISEIEYTTNPDKNCNKCIYKKMLLGK